jgi:hypothetical protein
MSWTYIITAASIIGTVANVLKKKWCFVIWLFTNTVWLIIDTAHGLYSQTILFAVYIILSVWGLLQWKDGYKPTITLWGESNIPKGYSVWNLDWCTGKACCCKTYLLPVLKAYKFTVNQKYRFYRRLNKKSIMHTPFDCSPVISDLWRKN